MPRAKRTEPPLTVHVQLACRAAGIPDPRRIRRWARAAHAGGAPAEVTVRVVGEREGRQLNRRWRHKPHATNVLSFPAPRLPAMPGALGDIAVCAPVVAREARVQRKSPAAHWAHLVVHGMLHLHGHDHVRRHDAEAMEALERRILARLGFPDPYLPAPR
jgi:probable rRNA maturation factor